MGTRGRRRLGPRVDVGRHGFPQHAQKFRGGRVWTGGFEWERAGGGGWDLGSTSGGMDFPSTPKNSEEGGFGLGDLNGNAREAEVGTSGRRRAVWISPARPKIPRR